MIGRRGFAALAASGFVSLARPASAAVRRIRVGFGTGYNTSYGAAARALAVDVAQGSNGRIKADLYPDATLGNNEAMVAAVQAGTLDVAIATSAPIATYAPEFGLLDLPFLFRDAEQARAALDGPEGMELANLARAKGLAVLAWGENGFRHLSGNRPLRTAEALRGLKLRVLPAPLLLDAFRAMGADVEAIPYPQLYEALLTGRVEAQENPLQLIRDAHLHEVQSHVTLTAHAYSALAIVASADLMEDLAAPDQAALVAASRVAAARSREYAAEADIRATEALQAKGMIFVTDPDRQSFLAANAPAEAAAASRFGADRIARLRRADA